VTQRRAWRGKPVSEIAADSAQRLREKMQGMSPSQTQAMMLTYRGVVAANRNDWETAKKDFLEAYRLDPNDAFTLNNAGYVSERNGDVETAQFFYTRARQSGSASTPVGLATRSLAEGQPLFTVAAESDHAIDRELARYHQERRQETGPIELIPRGPGTSNQQAPQPNQQNPNPQH
jgi:tetratricopeptide (TPR) repeat protein